jgi:hypothetical protein
MIHSSFVLFAATQGAIQGRSGTGGDAVSILAFARVYPYPRKRPLLNHAPQKEARSAQPAG